MKIPTEVDSKGRWVVLIDHHTLSTYNKCARKYYYYNQCDSLVQIQPSIQEAGEKILEGSRIQQLASQAKFGITTKGRFRFKTQVGIWWSDVMSSLYEIIAKGKTPLLKDCLEIGSMLWLKHDMNSYAIQTPENSPYEVKNYEKFCDKGFVIGNPGDVTRYPVGPFNMVNDYFKERIAGDVGNLKIIATEAGFGLKREVYVGENDYVVVFWVGKPDKIAMDKHSGEISPWDHKTVDYISKNFSEQWKPHPQTCGYVMATNIIVNNLGIDKKVNKCIINGAARLVPQKITVDYRGRFERVIVKYTDSEIGEWKQDVLKKVTRLREDIDGREDFRIINQSLHGEEFDLQRIYNPQHYTQQESSCHLFGGCEFRPICSQPPEFREQVIKSLYKAKEPWEPYYLNEED
jgi:hypothetical protein